METEAQQIVDPMDDAMAAEWNPTRTVFGELAIDVWHVVLVKGVGKVPFDPNQHSADQRQTAIKLSIQPLPNSKTQFATEREMIAQSKEWTQYVRPSLRALNVDLRGINGKWVRAELVPTGQKYTNKAGEEKERTAIKFVAIYSSQEECQAAADAAFGGNGQSVETAPEANGNENEKAVAAKFLPALWASSGKDIQKLSELLAKTPPCNKYFTIESPEVVAVIAPF